MTRHTMLAQLETLTLDKLHRDALILDRNIQVSQQKKTFVMMNYIAHKVIRHIVIVHSNITTSHG